MTSHLLMLSGGIDSAWCLWQRVQAGEPTRTHHVVLADHEGRAAVEEHATRRVLRWMQVNGGAGLIRHTESAVDFRTVRWIPHNYHLWAYWAGALMAAPAGQGLDTIILPRHSDAFDDPAGAARSDEAYTRVVSTISGREPRFEYPMIGLTKAEVVRSLPEELLHLCWWCRRPQRGRPCHRCRTCRQVDEALSGGTGV